MPTSAEKVDDVNANQRCLRVAGYAVRDLQNETATKLEGLFAQRRGISQHSIAWVFADAGSFIMSAGSDTCTPGWSRDCDLTILTNVATLDALRDGQFNPRAPKQGELFVWGGDPAALKGLEHSLRDLSPVGIRLWSPQ